MILLPIIFMTIIQTDSFETYLSNYPKSNLPYVYGSPNDLTYSQNNLSRINNIYTNNYICKKDSMVLHNNIYKYFTCPFISDSLAIVIYEISHGTGCNYDLAIYDVRKKMLIDRMTLFYEIDGGFWAAGIIDTNLIIHQDCYSYKYWAGSSNNQEVIKRSSNRLKISMNGIEVYEGKKIGPFKD
jgi:hypothetical protein